MTFHLQQFSLKQTAISQKVGTDTMLLGAWENVINQRLLDINTRCDMLALMMAQRNKTAQIDAVEIDLPSVISTSQQQNLHDLGKGLQLFAYKQTYVYHYQPANRILTEYR